MVLTSSGVVTLAKKINGKLVHSPGSNFWVAPDGWHVEGQFQAEKHEGHPWRQRILRDLELRPWPARKLGRDWELSKEERLAWDRHKLDVMRSLLHEKLFYEDFVIWLAATGEYKIVEINWWHDRYWGQCQCIKCFRQGDNNHLGKLLMALREKVMTSSNGTYEKMRTMYGLEAIHG